MADDFKLEGLDAAMAKLRALGDQKKIKRAVRAASTKAMRSVRDAARAGAMRLDDAHSPELIAKNIATQYSSRQSKGDKVVVRVGVRGGARKMEKYGEFKGKGGGNPGGDTFYWRFLEFGTQNMAARPFMRPALEANQEKVSAEFTEYLGPAIDKIIAKGR